MIYDLSNLVDHLKTYNFIDGFIVQPYSDEYRVPLNWPDGKINSFIISDINNTGDNINFNDFLDLSQRTITQNYRLIAVHEDCKSDLLSNILDGLTSFIGTSAEVVEPTSASSNSNSILEILFGEKPTGNINAISVDFEITYSPQYCKEVC